MEFTKIEYALLRVSLSHRIALLEHKKIAHPKGSDEYQGWQKYIDAHSRLYEKIAAK